MKTISKIFTVIMLFLALFLTSCSKDDDNPATPTTPQRTLNGTWGGTSDHGAIISLTLVQDGSAVTGSGHIQIPSIDVNAACNVQGGTCDGSNVSLTLTSQILYDISYQGQFSADNVHKGMLNGSGVTDDKITFVKQ